MKIGYIQLDSKFGQKEKNLEKIENLVCRAKEADLLILPEMATTGYMVKNKKELFNLAEMVPTGPSSIRLIQVAQKYKTHLVVGIPEKTRERVYSTALIVGPKGYIGKYRKTHLFLKEKLYFNPGNLNFPIFNINKVKIGIAICFDYMFPEIWRTLALKKVQVFCLPTNLVLPYCPEVMKTRSLENGCFSIMTNRIGTERGQKFTGGSQIIGPKMEILAKASVDKEEFKIIEINPRIANCKMITKYNHLLKDRRLKFYKLK